MVYLQTHARRIGSMRSVLADFPIVAIGLANDAISIPSSISIAFHKTCVQMRIAHAM
jgi:hypothetical protein